MKILQYLILLTLAIGVYPQEIENGTEVFDPTKFPFLAMFIIKYPISLTKYIGRACGGTLIHPQWILSVGRCLPHNESEFDEIIRQPVNMIFMGSIFRPSKTHGQARKIIEIHRHPDYVFEDDRQSIDYIVKKIQNNIALFKLNKPFKLTPSVHMIQLSGTSIKCDYGVAIGIALNWTDIPHGISIVSYAKVPLQKFYPRNTSSSVFYSSTEKKNTYEYEDSSYDFSSNAGGPVLCDDSPYPLQIGVLSASFPSEKSNETINLIHRVDHYADFINKYVPDDPYKRKVRRQKAPPAGDATKLTCGVFYQCLVFLYISIC